MRVNEHNVGMVAREREIERNDDGDNNTGNSQQKQQ